MYPSVRPTAVLDAPSTPRADQQEKRDRRVPANVVYLGLTSMFTDVSSEMVNSVLAIYLVFELRFTPLQFGLFNGIYLAVSGLMTIAGGVIADRSRRYKEVAGAGYGVSAACKLGLLAARNAPLPASAALFTDRVGKGVRSAPRDALISLSSQPERLGTNFGVHRAFDTAGAVAGPIVAFLILRAAPNGYDAVFVVSFLVALIGLGVLVFFVQNKRNDSAGHTAASWRAAMGLVGKEPFRTLVGVGTLFGLFTMADAFIYLTFRQSSSFQTQYFPLLYVGTAISYLVLAVPLGSAADRIGRSRVFLGGYVLLLGVYLFLLVPSPNGVDLVIILALLGAFYACTDGVLVAMASTAIPRGQRTSGLAVLTSAAAISAFVSSLGFGALWSWWGPTTTVKIFAIALAAMIVVAARWLQIRTRRYG